LKPAPWTLFLPSTSPDKEYSCPGQSIIGRLIAAFAVTHDYIRISAERFLAIEATSRLSDTDIEPITLAKELVARGEEVFLATEDRDVVMGATALNKG